MRPTHKTRGCAPLAAAALALLALSPARAGSISSLGSTGIVVNGGTLQPVGDPFGLITFDVEYLPAGGEYIASGDSFSVTSSGVPLTPLNLGSNAQPPGWYATFSQPVPNSPANMPPEFYEVTWTYYGSDEITTQGSLDPVTDTLPPTPLFQVSSPDVQAGSFSYGFSDHNSDGTVNSQPTAGTFDVTVVPEPATLIMAGSAAPAVLYLLYRSRRRRAAGRHLGSPL